MFRLARLFSSCCVLALGLASVAGTPAFALEKVRYNMSWLPQGSVGGTLVARSKGFFEKYGLEVEATRGYGGQRTVNEVDQGLFELGYGDPISLVLNRGNGGKTVMVGAINTVWPGGLCFVQKPDRSIKTLADIKGMTVGGGSASPVQNLIPAWLKMNGFPADHVKLLRMDPVVINPSLLEGRIDLGECWAGANRPLLDVAAAAAGKKVDWLLYRDFKLDIYGNGFVTTEKLVKEKPDMIRNFLKASYEGYAYMKANPEESADLIVKQFPTVNRNVVLEQIKQTNDLVTDTAASDKRIGFLREDRMKNTLDFVKDAFNAGANVSLKDIYSNDFIPK